MRRILNTAGKVVCRFLNSSRFTFGVAVVANHIAVPVLLWRIVSIHGVTGIVDLKGIVAVLAAGTVGWICVRRRVRNTPLRSGEWWILVALNLVVTPAPFLLFAWIDSYVTVAILLWSILCSALVFSLWSPALQSSTQRWSIVLANTVTVALFFGLLTIHGVTGEGRTTFEWKLLRTSANVSRTIEPETSEDTEPVPAAFEVRDSGAIVWPEYSANSDPALTDNRQLPNNWWSQIQKVWSVPVGYGWSGIASTETLIFTLEQYNDMDSITCRTFTDGRRLWTTSIHDEPYRSPYGGDGPRATPALFDFVNLDGSIERRVIAVGPRDNVICVRAVDGTVIWKADLKEYSSGEPLHHGLSASPLIVSNMVVVSPSLSHGPGLCALNQSDGKLKWKADSDWRSSYSSPVRAQLCQVPQILFHAGPGILSLDVDSGKTLWSFEWTNEHQTNASLPVVVDPQQGLVAVSTGYGTGAVLLKATPNANGQWTAAEVWKSKALKTKFSSLSHFDQMLVGLDDGILSAVDLETGQRLWKQGRYRHGQSMRVGNQLMVLSESGELVIVDPSQKSPKELANISVLTGKCWSAPVLAGDSILIRNDEQMVRLRIGNGSLHPETNELEHKD